MARQSVVGDVADGELVNMPAAAALLQENRLKCSGDVAVTVSTSLPSAHSLELHNGQFTDIPFTL